MIIASQSATLISYTPDPEQLIERAGRVCYKSEGACKPGSHVAIINKLKTGGHTSVLEHASATLHLVTNRAIGNEIVRHRAGCSYSQESTRYVNYTADKFGGEITVIKPIRRDGSPMTSKAEGAWGASVRAAELAYFTMIEEGEAPEIARDVLPLCTKTEIVATYNFRSWRHFLNLRLKGSTGRPHPQILALCRLIAPQLVAIAPTVFSDFAPEASA